MNEFLELIMNGVAMVLSDSILHFILNLLAGVVVFIVGMKISKNFVHKMFDTKFLQGKDQSVVRFLRSLCSIGCKFIVVLLVASIIGVPMASLAALVASLGLVAGMALQGSLSNFAGGVMILFFKPFSVGDSIVSGVHQGEVEEISLFYTILKTPDNQRIVLPNGVTSNSALLNASVNKTRRVTLDFAVADMKEVARVRGTILACMEQIPQSLQEPAPCVPITQKDGNGVVVQAQVWCNTKDRDVVYSQLIELTNTALQEK